MRTNFKKLFFQPIKKQMVLLKRGKDVMIKRVLLMLPTVMMLIYNTSVYADAEMFKPFEKEEQERKGAEYRAEQHQENKFRRNRGCDDCQERTHHRGFNGMSDDEASFLMEHH